MNAEVLEQLVWIKWLLIALALFFFLIAAAMVWAGIVSTRAFKASKAEQPFSEKTRDFLDKGLNAEARAVSEERIRSHPGDAYAFWYHAVACYRLGEPAASMRSLRKAEELQPDWAHTHLRPLIAAIESEGTPTAKAELRLITPNSSVNPDAPPSGGGPVT